MTPESSDPNTIMNYLIFTWVKQWEQFVLGRQREAPGPMDNSAIITMRVNDRVPVLRPSADFIRISFDMWKFFSSIYGGGPEVILRSNGTSLVVMYKPVNSNNSAKNRNRSTSESVITSSTSLSHSPSK